MKAKLTKSDKKNKRYKVVIDGKKTIHFGQKGGSTFIDHKNNAKKSDWIARHKVNENWTDPKTAGFWAKHILWNKPTVAASITNIESRFKTLDVV
tara:strand:- start:303 stop:587 length:285 start_codon:yes stop_codon:yes gene_type:complete